MCLTCLLVRQARPKPLLLLTALLVVSLVLLLSSHEMTKVGLSAPKGCLHTQHTQCAAHSSMWTTQEGLLVE